MKKKIFLYPSLDFDRKYTGGISRLYQIFCIEYDFNLEIIDNDFLQNHKPLENNQDILVIAGGDGTLHRVINNIPEEFLSLYKFGIIPSGTANEFAKSLCLPLTLEECAVLIANKDDEDIILHKVAIVNEEYKFLTGLLYGVACHVLQSTSQSSKIFWGSLAYNLLGLMSLVNFYDHIKRFKIGSMEFQTGYLIVNNASLISKDLTYEDIKNENRDLFSIIYVYPDVAPGDMIRLLVKNQARMNILNDPAIFYTQIKEVTLEFEGQSLFMFDGEVYEFSSPVNIKHHEKQIKIIASQNIQNPNN